MSWDVSLYADRGHCEGDWNFTHNCNGMIEATLADNEELDGTGQAWFSKEGSDLGRASWWCLLDDVDGPTGAALLHRIVRGLESDPGRFRGMNPKNGWGDYDSLLVVLRSMRSAVPEWPTTWSASG